MQQPWEVANSTLVDLLEILYWRVFGMSIHDACEEGHINKSEVLALLQDAQEALEGK